MVPVELSVDASKAQFWSISHSAPSLGSQRSPPSGQQETPLYLDVKLFSGSGIAAVPPGHGDTEGMAPCLLSTSQELGWWRQGAGLLCHSLAGATLSSMPQPDSEGWSLHLEGEWRMAERDGLAKQEARDWALQSQTAS